MGVGSNFRIFLWIREASVLPRNTGKADTHSLSGVQPGLWLEEVDPPDTALKGMTAYEHSKFTTSICGGKIQISVLVKAQGWWGYPL